MRRACRLFPRPFAMATAASALALLCTGGAVVTAAPAEVADVGKAAEYLTTRLAAWQAWPNAQRDHGTACVSCHTVLPYVLARPVLLTRGAPVAGSAADRRLLADVGLRVARWREVEPFYPDQTRGVPKTSESRGTESVLNALVLATRDLGTGTLGDDTRQAFQHLWDLQMRTGPTKGAWTWLNFRLEPWEAPGSAYFGAAIAAIAVARAPGGYAADAAIQPQLTLLRDYLRTGSAGESLYNRLAGLWAATALPGVLDETQRAAIVTEALQRQGSDGGWALTALAPWQRVDGTTLESESDGYATAFTALVLADAGVPPSSPALTRARAWLLAHQDTSTGAWPARSVNKRRDPATEAAAFMTDAATAMAVLALAR